MQLTLIKTETGTLLLEGREPGLELEYYDVDGEGGKASQISFAPWNQTVEQLPGTIAAEYDAEDVDSFWSALRDVLQSARAAGYELPDYAAE